MKQTRGILFGISFIVFGIACMVIAQWTPFYGFEFLGVACPIIGIIISILYWLSGLAKTD